LNNISYFYTCIGNHKTSKMYRIALLFIILLSISMPVNAQQNMTYGEVYNWDENDVYCFSNMDEYWPPTYYTYSITGKYFNSDSTEVNYPADVTIMYLPSFPQYDTTYQYYSDTIVRRYLKDTIAGIGLSAHPAYNLVFTPDYWQNGSITSSSINIDSTGRKHQWVSTEGCTSFEPCGWHMHFIEGIGGFGDYFWAGDDFEQHIGFIYAIKNNYQDTLGSSHMIMSISENKTGILKLYPNPAQDYVNIDLPITHNKAMLQIINIHGQLVKQVAITTGGLQRIATDDLPNGIYQLLISSNTKLIGKEKLVVVR